MNYLLILKQRWRWMRHSNSLERMSSLDEFSAFINSLNDPVFHNHEEWGKRSQDDCPAVLDALGFQMSERRFIDIGPGYGVALDVAKARGASLTYFVDYDPFVCTFNRLKGHRGSRLNIRTQLSTLAHHNFDFVWSKATFTVDRFLAREKVSWRSAFSRYPKLDDLLLQFDRLVAPGGVTVFCPHWYHVNNERKIRDVHHNLITETFLRHGYEILPWIEGHNREPFHPITYLKRAVQR
jgi:hypothetical protein